MTSIDKTTIPISKVAIILVFVGGLLAQYFTTLNAVKEGISDIRNETKIELNNIKNDQEKLWSAIDGNREQNNDLKEAIFTYIGTGMKPESPEIKKRRK